MFASRGNKGRYKDVKVLMNGTRIRRIVPLLVVALVVATAVLTSCTNKKNTAWTRNYQAFITRYNIYYNGDEHYKQTLKDMEKKYQDDYTQRLYVHPAEARANPKAPQPEGSFDRSIEKAQKAIQLRSIKKRPKKKGGKQSAETKEWMRRGEYNPFLHNAWLMMGRSQFYNGDMTGAAATMHYIDKQFTWLPRTQLEARLWQARSYANMDWFFEAEQILRRIKPEELDTKKLKELYTLTSADVYLGRKEYEKAIPFVLEAAKYASGTQKVRLNFLLGQLYTTLGRKEDAYKAFAKAGGASSADYRTKFNARIKQSEVYSGSNIKPEVNALKRMTLYDRNKDYLDQIYYAIGNLYLSRGDTADAISNYKLAAEKSTRNGIEKAISQASLGELYFKQHRYDLAQPCYAEAMPQLPEDFPNYKELKLRSDVLDELAVYSGNVVLQDSLLHLADMPEKDRLKVIDDIIKKLIEEEKKAEEEALLAEHEAQESARGNQLNNNKNAPTTFNLNTDDSWYFYNVSTRNSGKTEFQKRWGSRKLEDDWRRRNKASFSMSDFNTDNGDEDDEENPESKADKEGSENDTEVKEGADDPHNREYYLKQIPFSDEDKQTAHDVIQEGLYNMGSILKNKLFDVEGARTEYDRLLKDYPDNIYRLDAYYDLYLMYMRAGDKTEAEKWRQMILREFPDSPYGKAMLDPDYLDKLKQMQQNQEGMYDRALNDYMANRNKEVHQAYAEMSKEYPLSSLMPRMMFLDALAYVTEKKPTEFNRVLKEMLERYPDTELAPLSSAWLRGMAAGRELQAGVGNTRGMLWEIKLTNDSTAGATADGPLEFVHEPTSPQTLVLLYDLKAVPQNILIYNVASFNFNNFTVRDFDLEPLTFGELGMLIIRGFDNETQVMRYRSMIEPSGVLPAQVRPVIISAANLQTMLNRGASFEQYFQWLEDNSLQNTHTAVLPEAEYASPEEVKRAGEDANRENPMPEAPDPEEDELNQIEEEPAVTSDPIPEPEPEFEPEPEPNPEPAPATPKPAPLPVTPTPVSAPTPVPQPVPDGSEGDDPLLDD